jgi:hypothetical protein
MQRQLLRLHQDAIQQKPRFSGCDLDRRAQSLTTAFCIRHPQRTVCPDIEPWHVSR